METYLVEHFNTETNVIFYRVYAKGAEYLYNINLVERNLRYLSVPDYMYIDTRTNELVQIQLPVQTIFIRDEDENGNLIIYRMATQYEFDRWLATGFGGKDLFDRKLQYQLMKPRNRHAFTLMKFAFDKYFSENNDYESPIYTNKHYRFKPDFSITDEQINFIRFVPENEQQKLKDINDPTKKDMGINNIDISDKLDNMTHKHELIIKNEFEKIPKFEDLMEPLMDDMFSPIYWMRRKYAKVFMDPKKRIGKSDKDLRLPKKVMFRHKDDPRRFDDDDDIFNVVTASEIPPEVAEGLDLEGDDNEAISLMSRKEIDAILVKQEIFKHKFDVPESVNSSAPLPRKVAAAMRKDPEFRAKMELDIKRRDENKRLQKIRDRKKSEAEEKIANARAMAEAAIRQLYIAADNIKEIEAEEALARAEKAKLDAEDNFIELLNKASKLPDPDDEDTKRKINEIMTNKKTVDTNDDNDNDKKPSIKLVLTKSDKKKVGSRNKKKASKEN